MTEVCGDLSVVTFFTVVPIVNKGQIHFDNVSSIIKKRRNIKGKKIRNLVSCNCRVCM